MKRTLGRYRKDDPRDRLHLASPKNLSQRRQAFWFTPPAFDQLDTSMCVAYSGLKFLESAPIVNHYGFTVDWLYQQCKLVDEWPGENYDGTSVRALFKILHKQGYISGYQWAFDVPSMALYVLNEGPMVVGTLWTELMHYPDQHGYIHIGDGKLSAEHPGHAYVIKGVNVDSECSDGTKGAFRIINSWGPEWGKNGCASISFTQMHFLMQNSGEACAAKEVLKAG